MKVITISREFGSGGRELGKRMSELLGFAYYDKEIITAIAQESRLDDAYVEELLEKGLVPSYPVTIRRTFSYPAYLQRNTMNILIAQQKILKALAAKGDCIVMGQSADAILREHRPFNLFVYAELSAKVERCRERAPEGEHLTDRELIQKIKQVDAARAKSRRLLSGQTWGQKEGYHLCVNTTGAQIKSLAPHLADYAKYWLGSNQT